MKELKSRWRMLVGFSSLLGPLSVQAGSFGEYVMKGFVTLGMLGGAVGPVYGIVRPRQPGIGDCTIDATNASNTTILLPEQNAGSTLTIEAGNASNIKIRHENPIGNYCYAGALLGGFMGGAMGALFFFARSASKS